MLGASLSLAIVILASRLQAVAATPSGAGTLTDVANAYKLTSAGWISTALSYAQHLFFALVAIELAWTAITYLLQRDSLSDFIAQLVLKFMGVFFFLALLQNAPTWMPYIINSFSQAGATIGGGGVVLDPSSTFSQGLHLAKSMLGTLSSPSFFTAIVAVLISVLCAIGVVVSFAVVAGQLLVTLIESYIVISAGIFFLGFSGSRWTLPFSEKYVAYAVSVGIKLFMLYLIVGLGETLATEWAALFTPGVVAPPDVYIGVAGSALIFMLLGWHIPSLAASLMNGSPVMTLGAAASTIGTTVTGGLALASGGLAAAGVLGGAGLAAAASVVGAASNPRKLEQETEPASTVGVITGERTQGLDQTRQSARSALSAQTTGAATASTSTDAASAGEDAGESASTSVAAMADAGKSEPQDSQIGEQETPPVAASDAADINAAPQQTHSQQISQRPSASKDKPQAGPARTRQPQSILDILRGIRPPAFPNDAGGGTIHIRFKHHDSE